MIPTWFSTCPLLPIPLPACMLSVRPGSGPHICTKRRLNARSLPMRTVLHRRLQVVVDASPAGTLEQPECPVVGVEHHLLARARISADEEHSAVAQPDVRDLDLGRHPRQHHVLVAPVELIGLARREHQRHIGLRRRCRTAPPPRLGVAPAPRRSRRHSPDPRGLRRSVAASAAPASTWSRWPPASAPARPSTAPSFGIGWTRRS